MGHQKRPARLIGRTVVTAAAAGLATAGLIAAAASGAAAGTRLGAMKPIGLDAAHRTDPLAGSRAESLRIARRLLGQVVLPGGARRLPNHPVPKLLRQPSQRELARTFTDRYRLYALPGSLRSSFRFLNRHFPAGMVREGTGQSGGRHGVIELDVSFSPKRLPRGIYSVFLVDTVVRGRHGHSVLRVDAQVIWFPARSAAERLHADNYRAVRVAAFIQGTRNVRTVRKTFTSRAVVGKLVRLIDSLPASPGVLASCPAELVSFKVTFLPRAGQSRVVVGRSICTQDDVSVGGVAQPALSDDGTLAARAGHLLHVRQEP